MQFALSDEQQMIVDTTRAFVESELYPHEAEIERTGHLDMDLVREIQKKAIETGLYAANIPEEFGGGGLDTLTWLLYEKELGRAKLCAALDLRGAPFKHSLRWHPGATGKVPAALHCGREMGLPGDDGTGSRLRLAGHEGDSEARRR